MTEACRYQELLHSAIEATAFHDPITYSWFGRHSERLPPRVAKVMKGRTARSYLQTQLRNQLYSDLYICGEARPPIWEGEGASGRDPELVEILSAANKGTGCLENGWEIVQKQAGEVAVRRNRLTLWVTPRDLGRDHGAHLVVGNEVTLRLPKELRNVSPGYYFALSNSAESGRESDPLVRLYWNLKAEGAPLLMQLVTEHFNESGCYFQLKLLNNRSSYSRCDSGVLYCRRVDYQIVCSLLVPIYPQVERYLKAKTPAFTKELAPGLGLAEDPGGSESFGQHRCQLLADGMIRAHERGVSQTEDRLRIVAQRFSEAGIDIKHPFLGPGSTDCYTFDTRAYR
jgi:hypothetical protein